MTTVIDSSASDIELSDAHREFQHSLSHFLRDHVPITRVREAMSSTGETHVDLWTELVAKLDLPGLMIPEKYGGSGLGPVELAIVQEATGHSLLPGPHFATVVQAVPAILTSGDQSAQLDYLPAIAAGTLTATLAVAEPGGDWDPASTRMTARPDGELFRLHGEKTFVVDGTSADLVVTVARTGHGLSLFGVAADAPGQTRLALPAMDLTRRLAHLRFQDTPARLIGEPDRASGPLAVALDRAAAGLAAEQVGGAQRCLEMSVEFAKLREQFGRPIGSFQAIKHLCARMHISVEAARAAARFAARVAADRPRDLPVAASLAKAYCSDAFQQVAADTIQIHGAMGFTWEHDAHLYFKRAASSALLLGDATCHRSLLAERTGM
jgi:alkylation response protein AidB-like acyl-CoA dehydrogenase